MKICELQYAPRPICKPRNTMTNNVVWLLLGIDYPNIRELPIFANLLIHFVNSNWKLLMCCLNFLKGCARFWLHQPSQYFSRVLNGAVLWLSVFLPASRRLHEADISNCLIIHFWCHLGYLAIGIVISYILFAVCCDVPFLAYYQYLYIAQLSIRSGGL